MINIGIRYTDGLCSEKLVRRELSSSRDLGSNVAQCDTLVARSVREFNDIRAGTFDVWMHCTRARLRGRGGTVEEEIVGGGYHCLPMYNSELFKTVWTKVGQMCGYITCAKSYLSGQYTSRQRVMIQILIIILLPRTQSIIVHKNFKNILLHHVFYSL